MKKIILVAIVLVLGLAAEVAKADFTFGEPVNLGPVVNTEYEDSAPFISADGLSLYFSSDRPGGSGDFDIWVTTRESKSDPWSEPVNLGPTVNTIYMDWHPSITADGLELYFDSGDWDLYVATRKNKSDDWGIPTKLGPTVNTSDIEESCSISPDGLTLVWSSHRPGGYGDLDIWISTRNTRDDPWAEAVNVGPTINTVEAEGNPELPADGRVLFFAAWSWPDGYGDLDLWMSRWSGENVEWQTPVNLGPAINTANSEYCPSFSSDGKTIYFSDWPLYQPGGQGGEDMWQAAIIPIVDLNGDGIVDAADMCIVVEHWGEDYSLCDVGPTPFGDGVVDVQDLIVISEHLFKVYPSAETVDVNEADDGGQIELELDKLLVVTLESNPSTGYRWELVEDNESILKQFGEVEFKSSDTSDPPIVGADGWEIFRFKAVSAGQMTLELVYHRSWEDVEPLKTFSIQVVIP